MPVLPSSGSVNLQVMLEKTDVPEGVRTSIGQVQLPTGPTGAKIKKIAPTWKLSCANSESTLHQLSPYVGKLKSVIAGDLISAFTSPGDLVVDPFAGSGTVLLEAMLRGRRAFGADISPYASLLSQAKMRPPASELAALEQADYLLTFAAKIPKPDLRTVPIWIRKFFHPDTLRECIQFAQACRTCSDSKFVFSCFLGILHHQRPGFLSYPSSHLVPYLRDKKYPRDTHPELYEYRELRPRLMAKIKRAYRRLDSFNRSLFWGFKEQPVETVRLPNKFHCLITSPPYMNALDYGRDNRLRLWFLDPACAESIDASQSQKKSGFEEIINGLSKKIERSLCEGGVAIFIVGESVSRSYSARVTDVVKNAINTHAESLTLESIMVDEIPDIRRSRRQLYGIRNEHFLVYRKR